METIKIGDKYQSKVTRLIVTITEIDEQNWPQHLITYTFSRTFTNKYGVGPTRQYKLHFLRQFKKLKPK